MYFNDIKSSGMFALMLDESTDVTVDKRLSSCVTHVKAGEPLNKMLGNIHTIMNCVAQEFENFGIKTRIKKII
jgi:hypothetical protein